MRPIASVNENTRGVVRVGNVGIPVLVLLLSAFGVVMVYSASCYTAETQYGEAFYFMKKQLIGLILGAAAMSAAAFFPYRKLKKLKWPALILSLVLLALVFVPGLGVENYGATRWIAVGPITIQPSEIAKYGFVLFAAAYASEDLARMRTFKGLLPVLGAGCAVCALIIIEPNMSVTMCTGMVMLAMLFLSGVKIRHLLLILVPVVAAVPVLIVLEPYAIAGVREKTDSFLPGFYEYQPVARKVAESAGAVFVPLQKHFDEAGKKYGKEKFSRDGVHPWSAGIELITRAWIDAVEV